MANIPIETKTQLTASSKVGLFWFSTDYKKIADIKGEREKLLNNGRPEFDNKIRWAREYLFSKVYWIILKEALGY